MTTPYVYLKSEPGLWTVGFYGPDSTWHSESDHGSPDDAAKRCNWLNGNGTFPTSPMHATGVQQLLTDALVRAYEFLDRNFDDADMADILGPCRVALGKVGALPVAKQGATGSAL